MARYKLEFTECDAIQFTGYNLDEIQKWTRGFSSTSVFELEYGIRTLLIIKDQKYLLGYRVIKPKQYIVRYDNTNDEYIGIDESQFLAKYKLEKQ